MDLMDLMTDRVRILYEGIWDRDKVEVAIGEEFAPEVTGEMRFFADSRFLERQAKNPELFDGDALHLSLDNSRIKSRHVYLAVGPMKYSVYDICRKEFVDRFGWDANRLPTGMGVNVVVRTSDHKIVMHDRNPDVDHIAKISIIGGVYSGGPPFAHIKQELHEELGIEEREIEYLRLIGISNRLDERMNHELTFFAGTSLTAYQLLVREKEAVRRKEGKLFFLNFHPLELHNYLRKNYQRMLSTGFSGLVILGHFLWGDQWSACVVRGTKGARE